MTPENLSDVYFTAIVEIARLTAPVETRKTSMNLVHGNEVMTRIKKIIATVEVEEDKFADAVEIAFVAQQANLFAHRDAIISIHEWLALRDDNLTALEEVLSAYVEEHSYDGYDVELLKPNMEMATHEGLRKIIKTCQYALAEQLRRAIGVE